MEQGLTTKEAEEKLQQFGKNEIQTEEKISAIGIFLSQFPTLLNAILATAGVLSIIIHDILDGVFIFTILLVNGIVGFIQEYNAEKSLQKLKDFLTPTARVIRDGKEVQIATFDIVPGDIIKLFEGERIPADGILVSEKYIEVDESILTGESLPVEKKHNDDVLTGSLVIKGRGNTLVTKTGMQTSLGKIAQTLSSIETDKTPLQIRLDTLGKTLSFIAIGISLLLIPIGLSQGKMLFPLILLAASIAIAAIPESLPAIITIALGIGTNRMAKKHAIVRHMPAVETLGSVQIILTDKTGTLTQNAMIVKKCFLETGAKKEDMLKACLFGNTASLIEKTDGSVSWEVVGDKTDGALLLWTKEQKENTSSLTAGIVVDEYVFDPITKTVTTVFKQTKSAKDLTVFVRGAPEFVLANCRISPEKKDATTRAFNHYATEGLRVIGFAAKTITTHTKKRKELEQNLTFLGFIGIYDPPREEAQTAILTAKQAGVQPIMVTGDNDLTALAIAKEVGLIEEKEEIMTGDTMQKLSDDKLIKLLPNIRIFARVKPEDKLRLVELYKKQGFVVGVTGDGVNDALALKRADVGIAMGETGTDVAKEAADIVLTDDNFYTLVKAIEEGRKIYDNILKAITYLLSGNLAELSLVFFAILFGLPQPLLPTQILWINLVTDGLPALALAGDTKDKDLLNRKPRDPKSVILTKNRIIFIAVVGFGLSFSLLLLYKILLGSFSETFARTITFNALIIFHLFIALVVRKGSFFRPNRLLVITFILTLLLQLIITTIPFFQNIFHLGF
ncbi:MAG: cation-translocating P-type ATPase [Candidatus Levyibacteriota bacterium]|nr:MAG: cation-translocating P-type ATPase [Candidatus Levybacteria bacterium]